MQLSISSLHGIMKICAVQYNRKKNKTKNTHLLAWKNEKIKSNHRNNRGQNYRHRSFFHQARDITDFYSCSYRDASPLYPDILPATEIRSWMIGRQLPRSWEETTTHSNSLSWNFLIFWRNHLHSSLAWVCIESPWSWKSNWPMLFTVACLI